MVALELTIVDHHHHSDVLGAGEEVFASVSPLLPLVCGLEVLGRALLQAGSHSYAPDTSFEMIHQYGLVYLE